MLLTLRTTNTHGNARSTADAVITALTPAAWYRNATDVVSSGGFASIWADYASTAQGLALPGVAGNSATAPDSVPLSITGDIDIAVRVAPTDWTPATQGYFLGKLGGNAGYSFRLQATGELAFIWGYGAGYTPVGSTVATGFTDGAAKWVRVTVDVSNGSGLYEIKFYTAADSTTVPSSWTQLGTTITGGAAATIADSTAVLSVGLDTTLTQPLAGLFYRAIIKDGIDGTTVFDADFSAQAIGAGSFTESSSNAATVTINASGAAPAHIGKARDLLQGTGTNQPAYNSTGGIFTFDGADNFMVASTWTQAQPVTIVLAGKQVTWTSSDSVYDGSSAINTARVYQNTATPQFTIYAGGSGGNNSDWAVNTRAIVVVVFNGASSSSRVNDSAKVTGNASTGAMGGFVLGAAGHLLTFSNITAEEVIIFPSAFSDANQDAVITALNNALTVF